MVHLAWPVAQELGQEKAAAIVMNNLIHIKGQF